MMFTTVCSRYFKIENETLNCVHFEDSGGSFMLVGKIVLQIAQISLLSNVQMSCC